MYVMDKAYGEPHHRKPANPQRPTTPWEISMILFFGSVYLGVEIGMSIQEYWRRRYQGR